MGYAVYSEFPGCPDKYPDIGELLCLYKKLTADYDDLLKTIDSTNKKLDDYMNQMQTLVPGWINEATTKFRQELDALANELKQDMTDYNNQLNALMNEFRCRTAQQLQEQNNKFCKAIAQMQCWVKTTIQQSKDWLSGELQTLIEKDKELGDRIFSLAEEIGAIHTEVRKALDGYNAQIENYNSLMRLWYYERRWEDKKWLEEQINALREYVDNLPESTLPVDNPITGEMSSVNQFIKDWWEYVACRHGYTAGEWDRETWITCELFDASNITCLEFYTECKHKLEQGWERFRTFSPVTGEYVEVGTAIQQVFDYLNKDGITAQEYDDKQLSAGTYDGKDVTAKAYLRKEVLDV